MLLNTEWSFALLPNGSEMADTAGADFQPVSLPHDWLIVHSADLYASGDGWYRRTLSFSGNELDGRVFLLFDGIYMDASVYLNGREAGRHAYGYTPFLLDLTGFAIAGENELMVQVRYTSPNSRWYSGAGIFRDVTLLTLPETCMLPDSVATGSSRQPDGTWTLEGTVECLGPDASLPLAVSVSTASGMPVASGRGSRHGSLASFRLEGLQVLPWSTDAPCVYTLRLGLGPQTMELTIGFRDISLTADRGLFLNDKALKLHGVCLHHDLGLFGAAFHRQAAARQLSCLKAIGVNAIRTSHNPPARGFLELCDAMGFLVIDEAFDMWENPKTPFDYARFFDADWESDVASMVRRDRNHPCVFLWSIGNEISDTHSNPRAPRLTRLLRDAFRFHDPYHHADISIGSNYMPWEGAQRCAQVLGIAGYNYAENLYALHHREHPDWVLYGSETASVVSSRGIYHFPMSASILCDEDLQCSALGNSTTSWGHQNIGKMLADDLNTPYSLGQFVWAGIDYIGEPTPYHTRSSYFGLFDTAVFPKDSAFQYRSAWTQKPFVHIGITWDGNEGQMMDVPVMTNLPQAELFLGGTSLGTRLCNPRDASQALPVWHVPFARLPLRAVARGAGVTEEETLLPFGDAYALSVQRENVILGRFAFLQVSAVDASGVPVPNANDRVEITLEGPGRVYGMDNGDSTDPDGYAVSSKRLFSGKVLAVLEALAPEGLLRVRCRAQGLQDAAMDLPLDSSFQGSPAPSRGMEGPYDSGIFVRRLDLKALSSLELTPECPEAEIRLTPCPAGALSQKMAVRVVTENGIDSPCARATERDGLIHVTGTGDGHVLLRASCSNGAGHPRILSQLDLHLTGFGSPFLDPYAFVAGGLYAFSEGKIGPGNDHGFAFARDGESLAGFRGLDFGPVGSDTLTMSVFALDSEPHRMDVYVGEGADRRFLATLTYRKPSRWNVYQEETWVLPEVLRGVQTLAFRSDTKMHIGGFVFARQSRAARVLTGADADEVTGDTFSRTGTRIDGIGNNVAVTYRNLDFGDKRSVRMTLCGQTPLQVQPVTVKVRSGQTEATTLCEFPFSGEDHEETYTLSVLPGLCSLTLLFLPGSRFSLASVSFPDI